jgi:hypothetical protein
MRDYPFKGKEEKLVQELITLGIENPPLRDEIYCQLIKQTTVNPKIDSLHNGWHLINLCVGCFLPSQEFIQFLSDYITEMSTSVVDIGSAEIATRALARLREISVKETRKYPPCELEISAVRVSIKKIVIFGSLSFSAEFSFLETQNNNPFITKIFLLDGTIKSIHVTSTTTIKEATQDLNGKYGFSAQLGFSLFEVNHENGKTPTFSSV